LYSALILINRKHTHLRGVYSHELAHSLGYNHPLGASAVPLPSIMRHGHGEGPELDDQLHGAILYRRAPGSRSPDSDPQEFVINAVRDPGADVKSLIEEIITN
jgi:hypothetical protein